MNIIDLFKTEGTLFGKYEKWGALFSKIQNLGIFPGKINSPLNRRLVSNAASAGNIRSAPRDRPHPPAPLLPHLTRKESMTHNGGCIRWWGRREGSRSTFRESGKHGSQIRFALDLVSIDYAIALGSLPYVIYLCWVGSSEPWKKYSIGSSPW